MTAVTELDGLVATVLEIAPETVSDETKQSETAGWSSKRHLELVVSLEETYGVSFTTDEIVSMISVGRMRTVLRAKGIAV